MRWGFGINKLPKKVATMSGIIGSVTVTHIQARQQPIFRATLSYIRGWDKGWREITIFVYFSFHISTASLFATKAMIATLKGRDRGWGYSMVRRHSGKHSGPTWRALSIWNWTGPYMLVNGYVGMMPYESNINGGRYRKLVREWTCNSRGHRTSLNLNLVSVSRHLN